MAEAKKATTKKKTAKEEKPTLDETKKVDATAVETEAKKVIKEAKSEEKVAKAGKRSKKGIEEAGEKKAKLEHQKHADEEESEDVKPKKTAKPARSRVERRSKKFQEVAKLIDNSKEYSVNDAVDLAIKTSPTKFDATVELHVRLGVDPKQADQNIRGTVVLPAGSGKKVRVAVFADADDVKKAQAAGADIAGGDEFLQQLDKGTTDFDVLIATPKVMIKLSKYARLLGPKGLMPNPKSGTVAADVAKAVNEAKAGKVEYRVDSTGIVHLGVAKVSFKAEDIAKNTRSVLSAIKSAKPASIKSTYIQAIHLSTTMGPGIKIALSEA